MVYTDNQCIQYGITMDNNIWRKKVWAIEITKFELVNIDPDNELIQMVAECGYRYVNENVKL